MRVDVDDDARLRETQIHPRHKALPATARTAASAPVLASEQAERFVERLWPANNEPARASQRLSVQGGKGPPRA